MSTPPNPLEGLEIKAGTQSGTATQGKQGLRDEVASLAALNPRAARFAQFGAEPPRYGASSTIDISEDDAEPTAAVPVPNSPKPSAPSSSDVLHPDSQTALEQLGYDDETISKLNLPQVRTIIKHQLPAKHAAPAQTSSVPADSPFAKPADPAAPILAAAPISQDLRGDAWDAYHTSKDENEFADKITPLAIPDSIKDSLWQEKRRQVAAVPVAPVDKVVAAVQKMVALPDAVLRVAESRPKLLAAYTSAATEG